MRNRFAPPALLAAGLALMATAATADDLKGLYAGIGIGSTSVDGAGPVDDSDTSFKIFGGYAFNRFLALELSYLDGGTAKESADLLFPGMPRLSIFDEVENKIVNLSVLGNLPLTQSLSLFGKLGYAYIDTESKTSVFQGSASFIISLDDNERKELSYGVGATYSFSRSFQLRAEYEGFDVSRSGLSAISLSGILRF
jgi:OOP family OmpA-OmpF porin